MIWAAKGHFHGLPSVQRSIVHFQQAEQTMMRCPLQNGRAFLRVAALVSEQFPGIDRQAHGMPAMFHFIQLRTR
ncbi:hypothetical protein B5K06_21730 [Rhizobium grahamii]|uniref:Uncharacterized protein n=1 Tax=Rhizobium grahamii TaxID=1120045 RepID=A0A370KK51_9HYPH|nr:hypothetical protein B5K06_21730 [Rhizobium grahamii]